MTQNIKRTSDHIIETTDEKAYSQYIALRNLAKRISMLESQINMMMNKISDLEKGK